MKIANSKNLSWFVATVVFVSLLSYFSSFGYLALPQKIFTYIPRPITSLIANVFLPVKNFFSAAYQIRHIYSENGRLVSKVAELEKKVVSLEQAGRENESLRKELGFSKESGLNLQPCNVIAENIFSVTDGVTLDCGEENGIKVGQAILSEGFLAGKIVFTTKTTSAAILAVSSGFLVDAKLSDNGALGAVSGSYNSGLVLDRLPQAAEAKKGSIVVTAGINQDIPKNLLIGEVADVISLPQELLKKATVVSPVDFGNLGFVMVAK